jgi:hypothetical protein
MLSYHPVGVARLLGYAVVCTAAVVVVVSVVARRLGFLRALSVGTAAGVIVVIFLIVLHQLPMVPKVDGHHVGTLYRAAPANANASKDWGNYLAAIGADAATVGIMVAKAPTWASLIITVAAGLSLGRTPLRNPRRSTESDPLPRRPAHYWA